MKIEINLKIIFVLILFFILQNIDTYIIFLIFILIHEMFHLIVGILIGGKPSKLYLTPLGVSLEFYSYGKNKFIYKILFYLIGPISNLILAFLFLKFNLFEKYKMKIVYTNLAICYFNLIPILPLDGGKALREVLKKVLGNEKANSYLIIFSKIFLAGITFTYSILIIKIKNIFILGLLIYLWYLYYIEEKKYYIFKRTNDSIKKIIKS